MARREVGAGLIMSRSSVDMWSTWILPQRDLEAR